MFKMKDSVPMYGFTDHDGFMGIVWDTALGKIVTIEGKLNPKSNLTIREVATGKDIGDIDLRNILMSILPTK
jgi:hypothetical protein